MSDANWNKITEAERWSVGVTAHHLATSYERVPDIATGLAAGQSFGNFTRKMLDERNAQDAKFNSATSTRISAASGRRSAAESTICEGVMVMITGLRGASIWSEDVKNLLPERL